MPRASALMPMPSYASITQVFPLFCVIVNIVILLFTLSHSDLANLQAYHIKNNLLNSTAYPDRFSSRLVYCTTALDYFLCTVSFGN
jgi:hypothetical protein